MKRSRNPDPGRGHLRPLRFAGLLAVIAVAGLFAGGCAVGPEKQRLVSQPAMLFSEAAVFNDTWKLLPQTETGRAFSVGGQAGICTSCK